MVMLSELFLLGVNVMVMFLMVPASTVVWRSKVVQ